MMCEGKIKQKQYKKKLTKIDSGERCDLFTTKTDKVATLKKLHNIY